MIDPNVNPNFPEKKRWLSDFWFGICIVGFVFGLFGLAMYALSHGAH